MLTVGPFEMETEAASVCAPTSHTVGLSHCRSLLGDGGGCRVGVREGGEIEGYLAEVHAARRCVEARASCS